MCLSKKVDNLHCSFKMDDEFNNCCSKCDKSFSTVWNQKRHEQSVHNQVSQEDGDSESENTIPEDGNMGDDDKTDSSEPESDEEDDGLDVWRQLISKAMESANCNPEQITSDDQCMSKVSKALMDEMLNLLSDASSIKASDVYKKLMVRKLYFIEKSPH